MIRLALVLPLLVAACQKDETISGYADPDVVYTLTELGGRVFTASATISFPDEGLVRGSGPCNGYSAEQTAPYPWFQLSPLRATRRACPEMAEESEFFGGLQEMTLIEVLGDTLILRNDADNEMVFLATQP